MKYVYVSWCWCCFEVWNSNQYRHLEELQTQLLTCIAVGVVFLQCWWTAWLERLSSTWEWSLRSASLAWPWPLPSFSSMLLARPSGAFDRCIAMPSSVSSQVSRARPEQRKYLSIIYFYTMTFSVPLFFMARAQFNGYMIVLKYL